MSTRLTYTSGELGAGTDAEFEARLATARAAGGGEPLAHLIAGAAAPWRRELRARRSVHRRGGGSAARPRPRPRSSPSPSTPRVAPPGVAPDAVAAALRAAARDRRRDRRAPPRAGRGRQPRDRQVAHRVDSRGAGGRRPHHHLRRPHGGQRRLRHPARQLRRPTSAIRDVLRPYGVFAVISPFNFPSALAVGMTAAALVAGNTVVFKPSEETPVDRRDLGEIARAAELPPGVFNLVHGGDATGRALVDAGVDGVAFTGSAAVGHEIARKLQEPRPLRPPARRDGRQEPRHRHRRPPTSTAPPRASPAPRTASPGQKCSACSRAIVMRDVHDAFVERLAAWTRAPRRRRPRRSPASFLGPVVNAARVERFEAAVATPAATARVVAGGDARRPGTSSSPRRRRPPARPSARRATSCSCRSSPSPASTARRRARRGQPPRYGLTAGIFSADPAEASASSTRSRPASSTSTAAPARPPAPGPGCSPSAAGSPAASTGKGGLGPHYLPQFMREQSRTVVG